MKKQCKDYTFDGKYLVYNVNVSKGSDARYTIAPPLGPDQLIINHFESKPMQELYFWYTVFNIQCQILIQNHNNNALGCGYQYLVCCQMGFLARLSTIAPGAASEQGDNTVMRS